MFDAFLQHYESYLNGVEACLWFCIGMVFLVTLRRPAFRSGKIIAAVTFLAFGGSDLVEMHTENWWDPWWLFAWKAACVITFLVLLFTVGTAASKAIAKKKTADR